MAAGSWDELANALLGEPGVVEGTMFGMDCLKVGGRVFAGSWRGGVVVKVPRERVAELVAAGDGAPFDPGMGRVMREWVLVADPGAWEPLAREAHAFVGASAR